MSENVISPNGRVFAGMVLLDASPVVADDSTVRRVGQFDIPTPLREHAHVVMPRLTRCVWLSIGEFRYAGEDYTTAFCKWDGREWLYGVDSDD